MTSGIRLPPANDLWLTENGKQLPLAAADISKWVVVALLPNVPLIPLLLGIQVLNGILLPIILFFLLLLINDQRLVGDLRNGRLNNVLGWGTFAFVTIAVVVLLGSQLLGLLGIHLFGLS